MIGVTTLGPGNRFAIWVNGCPRRCEGCVSDRLQKEEPKNEVDVLKYLSLFDFRGVEGITISGGEPFMQLEELLRVVEYFNELKIRDILIYTGYTLSELKNMKSKTVDRILQKIAVLIDGPYVRELDFGNGNLKGSENQCVIYLDPTVRERYEAYYSEKRSMQEFKMGSRIVAVGIPDENFIKDFTKEVK